MQLDRIDFEILGLLQKDAQTPNKVIAAQIGLAASTCHERIKRMEGLGVIRGSHLECDLRQFGVGLQAIFMLKLSKHDRRIVDRFMQEVAQINEVRSIFLISGQYDVVAHVVVRDTEHLRDLALDQFTNREGVDQIETSIIYDARHNFELSPLAR
ncbi:Lrp/AsnC family transcriptional regulator [Azospirillum sp.]|uniref:Lrp/AsnC family transcriptional regulator n=1 Tax=Azospirillum sp. TaxID=34012 RepID=UPI002D45392D|nr:Lrp/AsnC family transcriptional regulator [Azospirillum sp.]HYF86380.1 Lrp/AsnC family transcriptional regulator [Azospirillum sp.]